ncbi:F0F1 ATP synthase subunit delta [Candidatus Curtissbacteria bacterium]|nr:F0F1 ATP synthase subunit delta [Candidatus Curtissbacteria bacterium]
MISRKKTIQIAKSLCKKCCTPEGHIEPSKIHLVLKALSRQKPAGYSNILKAFKRQVETSLAKEEVIVEAAQKPTNWKQLEKTLIEKTHARKILFKTNPVFISGTKITHGDWIWDATLEAKLKQLTAEI